jgi:hypothetical protein
VRQLASLQVKGSADDKRFGNRHALSIPKLNVMFVEHVIEPVRVLGWRSNDNSAPIVHAKMLVLGRIELRDYGHPDYGQDERLEFQPTAVWWGSANWTEGSRNHLEVGFVSHDSELLNQATDFIADVIGFSEPFGSTRAGPEPDMLHYEVDDAAMWEAWEQQRLDHEGDEDFDA